MNATTNDEPEALRRLVGSSQKNALAKSFGIQGGASMLSQHLSGHRPIQQVMADGLVTPEERDSLLQHLQQLVQMDFSHTGAAVADGPALPVNDAITVILTNCGVCHTGEFMFGTRAAVERATLKAGGMPVDSVTRRTDLVVIGTRVSPHWIGTTYGRKIQRAVELRDAGSGLEIISERRWLAAIGLTE